MRGAPGLRTCIFPFDSDKVLLRREDFMLGDFDSAGAAEGSVLALEMLRISFARPLGDLAFSGLGLLGSDKVMLLQSLFWEVIG